MEISDLSEMTKLSSRTIKSSRYVCFSCKYSFSDTQSDSWRHGSVGWEEVDPWDSSLKGHCLLIPFYHASKPDFPTSTEVF